MGEGLGNTKKNKNQRRTKTSNEAEQTREKYRPELFAPSELDIDRGRQTKTNLRKRRREKKRERKGAYQPCKRLWRWMVYSRVTTSSLWLLPLSTIVTYCDEASLRNGNVRVATAREESITVSLPTMQRRKTTSQPSDASASPHRTRLFS